MALDTEITYTDILQIGRPCKRHTILCKNALLIIQSLLYIFVQVLGLR